MLKMLIILSVNTMHVNLSIQGAFKLNGCAVLSTYYLIMLKCYVIMLKCSVILSTKHVNFSTQTVIMLRARVFCCCFCVCVCVCVCFFFFFFFFHTVSYYVKGFISLKK